MSVSIAVCSLHHVYKLIIRIAGIWGVFETQDTSCGVPPCPDHKVWDFNTGACADCSGTFCLLLIPPRRSSFFLTGSSRLMNSAAVSVSERDNIVPQLANQTEYSRAAAANRTHALAGYHRHQFAKHRRSHSLPLNSGTSPAHAFRSLEKRNKWCEPFWLPRPQPDLFPQIPAAWQGGAAEGPSAEEIASSTTAQDAFQVRRFCFRNTYRY